MGLRAARPEELAELSALCLRSKAYWGYDDDFMAACREELTLDRSDLDTTNVMVLLQDAKPVGLVQLRIDGHDADLLKLFVDPAHIGEGHGRDLIDWALHTAIEGGAKRMQIEADPDAVPFYEQFGAKVVGSVASGSIPGRELPLLTISLATS